MVAHTYRHKLNSCKHIGETSYVVFIVRCMFNVGRKLFTNVLPFYSKNTNAIHARSYSNVTTEVRLHHLATAMGVHLVARV